MASRAVLNVGLSLFLSLFLCLSANLYCLLPFCLASSHSFGSIADSHNHHHQDEHHVHSHPQKHPEAATTVRLSALPSVEKKLIYHNSKSSKGPSSFRAAADHLAVADEGVKISLSDVLDLVLSAQLANSTNNFTSSNVTSAGDTPSSAAAILNSSQSVADSISPNSTVDLKNNQNNVSSSSSSLLSKQAVVSLLSAILSSHRNTTATSPFHNATSSSSVSSSSSNETHHGSVTLGESSESTQSESGETDFLHALLQKKLDLLNSIGKKGLRATLSDRVGAVVSRKQHWKKAFLKRKEERQKRRQQRRKDRTAAAALRRRRTDDNNVRPHKSFFWPFGTDDDSQDTTRFGLEPLDLWFYSEDDENLFENDDDDEHPFGPLSEEEYRELIESGDIEPVFWPEVIRGSQQFNGKWQADLSRSDSVDKLLQQLGFGLIKRRVIDSYPSLIEIDVDTASPADEPSMWMQTVFPLGITKQAIVRFNGEEVEQPDSDTGLWYTKPYYINGRIIQRRVSPLGIMYDTRAIFASDPMGIFDGPTMLFKWTFIPKGKPPVVAMRWLRKLA